MIWHLELFGVVEAYCFQGQSSGDLICIYECVLALEQIKSISFIRFPTVLLVNKYIDNALQQ